MVAGLVDKLDDYGKPAWIALMVIGFIVFWPVGLAVLFYLIGSGRMKSWKHRHRVGRWHHPEGSRGCGWGGWSRRQESTGNVAFDEYREETMRRLEEEQKEFRDFLDRLRAAKDKSEFDAFMAERRNRPATPPAPSEPFAPSA